MLGSVDTSGRSGSGRAARSSDGRASRLAGDRGTLVQRVQLGEVGTGYLRSFNLIPVLAEKKRKIGVKRLYKII